MTIYNKPRSEQAFYKEYPSLRLAADANAVRAEDDAKRVAEHKERLRITWRRRHGEHAGPGIPFESCGDCYAAFREAADGLV